MTFGADLRTPCLADHQLVGYDRETRRPVFTLVIPASDERPRLLFPFDRDDLEGIYNYEIDYGRAHDLAGMYDKRPPDNLLYFIEPYP